MGAYTKEALIRTDLESANAIIDFFNKKRPRNLLNPEVFEALRN